MKKNKGISLIILVLIIVLIVVIGSISVFVVIKSDNAKVKGDKSKQASTEFFTGDYSLVYDVSSYSDSYWNSQNSVYSAMTNREYFFNKYMFQVVGQSSSNKCGGNLAMPLKPDYAMYYRIYEGGGAEKTCEYFLKVEFNQDHIFYPSMMLGTLEGTSDSMFTFSILDKDMNFNPISANFKHYSKTTKMQNENNSNYKLIYEDNEWAFFETIGNSGKTTIYADYYVNIDEYDYINFTISLNGKLDSDAINELVNKLINNIKISKIEDKTICDYIDNLRPSDYYLKLNSKDELIKVSEKFTLDMTDTYIRLWGSSDSRVLGVSSTSTNNVNMLQWYDKKWKDGLVRIQLLEYPNGSNYGIENVAHACFGADIEIKDYNYKNLKIKLAYDTNSSSYRVAQGYSNFIGIIFELDNNIYTIESSKYLKETEISSYIQYLFDNVILINQ